jgi:hypothetical protein
MDISINFNELYISEVVYKYYNIISLILDHEIRWGEWSASGPVRALHPENDPRYSLDRRLGGSQS